MEERPFRTLSSHPSSIEAGIVGTTIQYAGFGMITVAELDAVDRNFVEFWTIGGLYDSCWLVFRLNTTRTVVDVLEAIAALVLRIKEESISALQLIGNVVGALEELVAASFSGHRIQTAWQSEAVELVARTNPSAVRRRSRYRLPSSSACIYVRVDVADLFMRIIEQSYRTVKLPGDSI